MKNLLFFLLLCLTVSCVDNTFEQEKKNEMIKPSIYNAVNFSGDYNRESNFFDANLQRVKNILSTPLYPETGNYSFLVFEYIPIEMPETAPDGKLFILDSDGETWDNQERILELTDRLIYFFIMVHDTYVEESQKRYYVEIGGQYVYSEWVDFYKFENLSKNSIVEVRAWNKDENNGYITSDYPACGFFEVSELNGKVHGVEKAEYNYSYGRKKIINSENFIKTRFTFMNLSMYQQNLIKSLCNSENLTINGVQYQLIGDFSEKNKSEDNEICDLQADFVQSNVSHFLQGSSSVPSEINETNFFIN